MSDLRFAEPQWVHLLWVVLGYVAALVWCERRRGHALARFVSAGLQMRLVRRSSRTQHGLRIALLGLTGTFLTLALMRPQWGSMPIATPRVGAEIMICLDVSNSMLAEDVAPNRLGRAKAEIRDLLSYLAGDQVGLIAFAGRATVLSPLTPDFGFLRLALDDAGPGSVTRGGTRLEEPIRKAIAGFGEMGETSRSILLITDGEDHDSFPLEAARAAAERGIRILAVGFGSETGSEIRITDPRTHAPTVLRDADGVPVRTRLDGALLRKLALATGGAYIPAGTGVLDLKSIYERHIAPLTRGPLHGRTRTVHTDVYPWVVLLAALSLLAALLATGRPGRLGRTSSRSAGVLAVAAACLLLAVPAQRPARAAESGSASPSAPGSASAAPPGEAAVTTRSPRALYREGLRRLKDGDAQGAAELLERARAGARSDREVRVRATYGLGWAAAKEADALVEHAPEKALASLERSAAWFREAVSLRPAYEDARYNLEIIERRITELADTLATRHGADLARKLDTLIGRQRQFLSTLGAEVARARAHPDPNVSTELRDAHRALSARELGVLGDADELARQARRELEALQRKDSGKRTPEEGLRLAQLEGLGRELHLARDRLTRTRGRLRRLEPEAAYRPGAGALDALKRARDRLLDPAQRIDALLEDGSYLAELTRRRARNGRPPAPTAPGAAAPAWLTPEYLSEAEQRLGKRAGELAAALQRGTGHPGPAPAPAPSAPREHGGGPRKAQLLATLHAAAPSLQHAADAFAEAGRHLARDEVEPALAAEGTAEEALLAARELFLDLRRLIELTYRSERPVAAALAPRTTASAAAPPGSPGPAPASTSRGSAASPAPPLSPGQIAAVQHRNVERMGRLGRMLSDRLAELAPEKPGAALPPGGEPKRPAANHAERERLERAMEHWRLAKQAMLAVERHLAGTAGGSRGEGAASAPAHHAAETAVAQLEELRRLFFTLLEHLRETAARQRALGDETERLAALGPGVPGAGQPGPLGARQQHLAERAATLARALSEQAARAAGPGTGRTAPNPPRAPASPGSAPAAKPSDRASERLGRASKLVAHAGTGMGQAAASLTATPADPAASREHQAGALHDLEQAIALLSPPPTPHRRGGQKKRAAGGTEKRDRSPEHRGKQAENAASMSQLLQEVRDHEAERRRARAAAVRGYEPVEKDW